MSFSVDYLYREKAPVHGLSVAIESFMKAWLRHSNEKEFLCHTPDPESFRRFAEMARAYAKDPQKPCLRVDPRDPSSFPGDLACLFVPDPDLSEVAWRRARLSGAAYAACGLVHSMSGDQVSRAVADLCLAPTHGGDALICPSRAIQNAVRRIFELHEAYLNRRFKTSFVCPVQTPVIPIGIDTDSFAARVRPDLRAAQRETLGLTEDDVAILFVGRLNFLNKAHPLPLLLAAQRAAQMTRRKLHLILHGTFMEQRDMESRFQALLRDFGGPPAPCRIVANDDPRFPHGLWAAADIFASLVDNVQESFGLTPIEAMACGLPAVVSDWDGYRDGVRHGLDGFLIPTLAPPVETGMDIANAFFDDKHYGRYLCAAAQSTAIDIEAAARAFTLLAESRDRRLDMGAQAQARARAVYDWRVIVPAYENLWRKLGEDRLRGAAGGAVPPLWQAVSPAHPNPWRVFESFPSRALAPKDRLRTVMARQDMSLLFRHDMNLFAPDMLLPVPLIEDLAETVRAAGTLAIEEILAVAPESERSRLWRTIGWLLKHGVCEAA